MGNREQSYSGAEWTEGTPSYCKTKKKNPNDLSQRFLLPHEQPF